MKKYLLWVMITALTGCFFIAGCTGIQENAQMEDPVESSLPDRSVTASEHSESVPDETWQSESSPLTHAQDPESGFEPVFRVDALSNELLEYMSGRSWKEESPVLPEDLRVLTVTYHTQSGGTETGLLVVHCLLADEVEEIFQELFQAEFPIAEIRLVDDYEADDVLSMEHNNTYGYCTRKIMGTDRYSMHSFGMAVDINPVQNPYLTNGMVQPEQGILYLDRTDIRPGMIVEGGVCYQAFVSRGWTWGGDWAQPDYQHFEKDPFQAVS